MDDSIFLVNYIYNELGAKVGDITFISFEWVINDHLAGNIPEWASHGF